MSTITYYKNTSLVLTDNATVSSPINVFGLFGSVTNVSMKLSGLSHSFPDDIDALLLAPNGVNNLVFMSDAGGSAYVGDLNLTFSDTGAALLPSTAPLISGSYLPTNYNATETAASFGLPATVLNSGGPGGTSTFASAFSGLIAPNGVWRLFLEDDISVYAGSLDAWELTITSTSDTAFVAGEATNDLFFVGSGALPDEGLMSLNGNVAKFSGVKKLIFEGGNGDDSFFGGAQKDRANGGADDDLLSGGGGKDKLFGDAGNDTLLGGEGKDKLTGGLGVDLMAGGLGKDRFIFVTTDNSGLDGPTRDIIDGFKRGEDKIDLSAIDARTSGDPGNDKFSSDIEKSNSFDGQGRIIYKTFNKSGTANDRTVIKINVDDDGAAEMTIHLRGVHHLTASDFIL